MFQTEVKHMNIFSWSMRGLDALQCCEVQVVPLDSRYTQVFFLSCELMQPYSVRYPKRGFERRILRIGLLDIRNAHAYKNMQYINV